MYVSVFVFRLGTDQIIHQVNRTNKTSFPSKQMDKFFQYKLSAAPMMRYERNFENVVLHRNKITILLLNKTNNKKTGRKTNMKNSIRNNNKSKSNHQICINPQPALSNKLARDGLQLGLPVLCIDSDLYDICRFAN